MNPVFPIRSCLALRGEVQQPFLIWVNLMEILLMHCLSFHHGLPPVTVLKMNTNRQKPLSCQLYKVKRAVTAGSLCLHCGKAAAVHDERSTA